MPGLPEAILCDSGDHSQLVQLLIVMRLGLGGWDIADRLEEAAVVESVHPFERGEFHRFCVSPRATTLDYLGLEQAVDGFSEGIVAGIADAADGRLDPCVGQAFSVAERDILGGFNRTS